MGEFSNHTTNYSAPYEDNTFNPDNQSGTVYIRIAIPELKIQKCLQFQLDDSVWQAKQRILSAFAKDLRDSINYGLYSPPTNGRAGKFLDEERLLQEYPLQGPIGFLEFKYKRRVYKVMQINPRKLKQLHTKSNLKHFIDLVKKGDIEKINKLTSKGLDPNFHDHETGETPITLSFGLSKEKSREMMITLVSAGAHLDFRNKQGLTPLHKASSIGNMDSVKTLLDLGASPNYKDGRGLTPLYYAVCNETNPLVTEMLLHERALIGLQDEQGWFEIHQACKYGHVQHLEHLLYYGADMDVQNASGNTPLHVCAVFNQESCARVLLFRGCNKDIINYNNQTPFQVAIIANNIDLAEIIKNNKPEEAVPFREMPKYSERRKSKLVPTLRGAIHRSRSDPRLNISAVEEQMLKQGMSNHSLPQLAADSYSNGSYPPSREYNSDSPRSLSISSTGSGPGYSSSHVFEYLRARLYPAIPHRYVICVNNCEPKHPTELRLNKGDVLQVLSVGDQGYYEGRTEDGREGWFQGTNVKDVTLRRAGSMGDLLGTDTVTLNRNTLAALINSDRHGYAPRMVVLHKSPEGFGFVLRGARSQSHSGTLDFQPTAEFPALQYLDSVDQGSQADRVGLKAGDFLLEINGENVVRASHERVVQLIRAARSTLAMKVMTVRPVDRSSDWYVHQDGVMTLPNRKKQAPAPPRRDPQTSLSYSKATSKSMAEGLAEIEKLDQTLAEYDGNPYARRSSMPNDPALEPKTASVRASHAAKRMSVVDLDSIMVNEKTDQGKMKSKEYQSPSELRILKYHKKQNGSVSSMERSKSTPDLAGEMVLSQPQESVYAKSGVESGTGAVNSGATWSKSRSSAVVRPPEPSSLRGPIYMTPSVKKPATYVDPKVLHSSVSTGNTARLNLNQSESPYSIPQVPNRQPTPKRPAPPPPVRGEVVSISTAAAAAAAATYANVSESIQEKKKQESPYESSFRPGTLARLTKQPQVSTASLEQAKLKAHQRSASAGNIAVPQETEDEKPSVSFAEDKVYESAASFIQKHPNATLLVTADVHKGQKKDKKFYEPEPDYDVDSDEDKSVSSSSSMKVHGTFSRQSSSSSQKSSGSRSDNKVPASVTVISVGNEGIKKSSPLNKRYTIHSDIPSSSVASYSSDSSSKLVIPPRPAQPAPLPPSMPSSNSSSRRSSIQSNFSGDISSDRINMMPPPPATSTVVVQSNPPVQSYTTPPPQTAPPPPPPPPPPVAAAPPPPPPPPPPPASYPPPVPSSTPPQLRPTTPKHAPPVAIPVPTDAILAAVAKRQARMQTDGPQMAPERPTVAPQKSKVELNHEALKAAVARRKNLLDKVEDEAVVETIESKLQKTKKLQSAKYFFSSDTINRKDTKGSAAEKAEEKTNVPESFSNTNTLKTKKAAAPPPPTVKPAAPVVETKAKPVTETKTAPSVQAVAKETPANGSSETKSDDSSEPSDYLAAAEKRRQEWLQKKSNNDTGTLQKKKTTPVSKSDDPSSNKIEVIPLKKDDPASADDSKVSIRDRIRKLEKANLNLNGTLKTGANVELGGVTEDHSHTEAGLTLSRNKKGAQNGSYGIVAPPPEFNDSNGKHASNAHGLIQIDIIPPPANFGNESSTDESGQNHEHFSSAFGHDDAASLVSSVSTLSTLSSEQGDGSAGSPPAKHASSYDDMIPPPPPGFDDSSEQMYDEIHGEECIPPPPQFGGMDGKNKPVRPFQTKAVESWLCTDVMDWLDSLNMGQYRSSFAKNCIDGPKLIGLGRNDYIELGVVQVGHRMNLERSIKKVAMRKTAL